MAKGNATRLVKVAVTKDEGDNLVSKARAAAVAMAEYWDALRQIEVAHNVTLESGQCDLIASMAGDCSIPPSFDDLKDSYDAAEILDQLVITKGRWLTGAQNIGH